MPHMIGQPQPAPEPAPDDRPAQEAAPAAAATTVLPREIGGREGPEPTRYGDWEKNGRCIDF